MLLEARIAKSLTEVAFGFVITMSDEAEIALRNLRVSESDVLTLIVNDREFVASRRKLTEGNAYFKALLGGSFSESKESRVELQDIKREDSFAVLLDYILNEKVTRGTVTSFEMLKETISLTDMFMVEGIEKELKDSLRDSWHEAEDVASLLSVTEKIYGDDMDEIWQLIWHEVNSKIGELGTFFLEASKRGSDLGETKTTLRYKMDTENLFRGIILSEKCPFKPCFTGQDIYEEVAAGLLAWSSAEKLTETMWETLFSRLGPVKNLYLREKHITGILKSIQNFFGFPHPLEQKIEYAFKKGLYFKLRERNGFVTDAERPYQLYH